MRRLLILITISGFIFPLWANTEGSPDPQGVNPNHFFVN